MQRFLATCLMVWCCGYTHAEEAVAVTLKTNGLNRIVSIDGGKMTVRVPGNWSIIAENISSKQTDFEALGDLATTQWESTLLPPWIVQMQWLNDNSDPTEPTASYFALQVHEDKAPALTAETLHQQVIDGLYGNVEILISPRVKTKSINGREYQYFRCAFDSIVAEHVFVAVDEDTYQITLQEISPAQLPSAQIIGLLGRVEIRDQ